MKRILMLVASVAMAVALTGCGSKDEKTTPSTAKDVAGEPAKTVTRKVESKASRFERIFRENFSMAKKMIHDPRLEPQVRAAWGSMTESDVQKGIDEFKNASSSEQDERLSIAEAFNEGLKKGLNK